MLTTAGCAEPPATAQVALSAPPVPAGQARIWFYRNWLPSESLNLANIDVNGSYYGSIANGSAFSFTSFESRGHPADQILIVEPAQIEISVVRRRLERLDKLREFAFCFPAHLFGGFEFDRTETQRIAATAPAEPRQIGRDHGGNSRVSACRPVIGEKRARLPEPGT